MVTWVTTEKRRWKEVERGETIETASGARFVVVSNEKAGKGERRVKIKGKGGTFTKTVESKKKTEVVLIDKKSAGKGVDFERLRRENEDKRRRFEGPSHGAAVDAKDYTPDPWKVDPADTLYARAEGQVMKGNGGPWDKSQDAAEERAVEILGAKMLGIQKEPGGLYAVPTIDRTTIRAHVFVMHGRDVKDMSESDLIVWHNIEHEKPPGDLYVPHYHSKDRP